MRLKFSPRARTVEISALGGLVVQVIFHRVLVNKYLASCYGLRKIATISEVPACTKERRTDGADAARSRRSLKTELLPVRGGRYLRERNWMSIAFDAPPIPNSVSGLSERTVEALMCIAKTVGPNAANRLEDVKAIQVLLNLNRARAGFDPALVDDDASGANTRAAIEAFQRTVIGTASPNGRVDPSGATLRELHAGMPPAFSELKLRGTMRRARDEDLAKFLEDAPHDAGIRNQYPTANASVCAIAYSVTSFTERRVPRV